MAIYDISDFWKAYGSPLPPEELAVHNPMRLRSSAIELCRILPDAYGWKVRNVLHPTVPKNALWQLLCHLRFTENLPCQGTYTKVVIKKVANTEIELFMQNVFKATWVFAWGWACPYGCTIFGARINDRDQSNPADYANFSDWLDTRVIKAQAMPNAKLIHRTVRALQYCFEQDAIAWNDSLVETMAVCFIDHRGTLEVNFIDDFNLEHLRQARSLNDEKSPLLFGAEQGTPPIALNDMLANYYLSGGERRERPECL